MFIEWYAKYGEVIHIGRVGENRATKVYFDITDWISEILEETAALYNTRSVEDIVKEATDANFKRNDEESNSSYIGRYMKYVAEGNISKYVPTLWVEQNGELFPVYTTKIEKEQNEKSKGTTENTLIGFDNLGSVLVSYEVEAEDNDGSGPSLIHTLVFEDNTVQADVTFSDIADNKTYIVWEIEAGNTLKSGIGRCQLQLNTAEVIQKPTFDENAEIVSEISSYKQTKGNGVNVIETTTTEATSEEKGKIFKSEINSYTSSSIEEIKLAFPGKAQWLKNQSGNYSTNITLEGITKNDFIKIDDKRFWAICYDALQSESNSNFVEVFISGEDFNTIVDTDLNKEYSATLYKEADVVSTTKYSWEEEGIEKVYAEVTTTRNGITITNPNNVSILGDCVKSCIYDFIVTESLSEGAGENAPKAYQSWVDEVTAAAVNIKDKFDQVDRYITDAKQSAGISKSWAVGPDGYPEMVEGTTDNNSHYWSEMSKKYAIGPNNITPPSDTHNALYYSGQAANSAAAAANSATEASNTKAAVDEAIDKWENDTVVGIASNEYHTYNQLEIALNNNSLVAGFYILDNGEIWYYNGTKLQKTASSAGGGGSSSVFFYTWTEKSETT